MTGHSTSQDDRGRLRILPKPVPPRQDAPSREHLLFIRDTLIYELGIDRLVIWISRHLPPSDKSR
jgi:hypothetical protein